MRLIEIYLKKGLTLEEAEAKAKEVIEKRKLKCRETWKNNKEEILKKRTPKIVAKTKGQKRSEEAKQKMSEANKRYRELNPEESKQRYVKSKETFANKTIEEKDVVKKKRSKAMKKFWESYKETDACKERNSQIRKSLKGRERSVESRFKQSVKNTGKKHSEETLLKRAKNRAAKVEKGEYLGVKCKFYKVGELQCQGKTEKAYIENLIKENKQLPTKGTFAKTPLGYYHPDFEFEDRFIEIKSEFTYGMFTCIFN